MTTLPFDIRSTMVPDYATSAESLLDRLDAIGLEYDVDYTTLYGHAWVVAGVQILTERALKQVQFMKARKGLR